MAKIPEKVRTQFLIPGWEDKLLGQGKVRDTYEGRTGEELMVLATDRLSIFDVVLPDPVPMKGVRLTQISLGWFGRLNIPNHLIPAKSDPSRNAVFELGDSRVPVERSVLVRKARVLPYELIFRHHIGGSVYKGYLKTGMAAGVKVAPGLPKWSALQDPLFTPSTKAEDGHDVNITQEQYFDETGEEGRWGYELALLAYQRAYRYARERGILILDTKMEVGVTPDRKVILIDEVLTPDSSRFAKEEQWKEAMAAGKDPEFYDKEPVRNWGRTVATPFTDADGKTIVGINNLDPENPEHVAFVHSLTVPEEVIFSVVERYQFIREALLQ